jgi:hypothetical protein
MACPPVKQSAQLLFVAAYPAYGREIQKLKLGTSRLGE